MAAALPGTDPEEVRSATAAFEDAVRAAGGADAARCRAGLERRYRERHRAYHTLAHVATLVRLLREHATPASDRDALVLAAWYHDAIYRPRRSDNERASAALAETELTELGVRPSVIARVIALVLATERHQPADDTPDPALFLDCDLSVLGSEPPVYDAYRAAIRREFRWVPAPLYRSERAKVLRRFLERPRIYFTASFHDRLEAHARANLAAEIGA